MTIDRDRWTIAMLYPTGRGNYPAFNVEIIGGRGVITLVHCTAAGLQILGEAKYTEDSINRPNLTMLSSLQYCSRN